ncbi:MAG: septum site-determining protein MinC [Bacillota bacterium]
MREGQDVVFRGVKDGLYLTLNANQEFSVLKEKLKEHLKQAEHFFHGSDVTLDTGDAQLSLEEVLEVQHILAYPYGLRLKRIVHGSQVADRSQGEVNKEPPALSAGPIRKETGLRRPATQSNTDATLLHRGTLRSGQRIVYDGNVVILGDVNPGAEIRASGDIAVLGSLRGLAHAGADGDTGVSVVAFRLAPTQLRIADVIGRPPEDSFSDAREPEIARLRDGIIVVEPMEGTRWEGEH